MKVHWILFAIAGVSAVQAQGVGKTGTTKPPGCAEEIEYRVVAQKNLIPPGGPGESKTVTTWIELKNVSDFECKFVLCYMLDLMAERVEMPSFTLEKDNRTGSWSCRRDGTADGPPNFHFGCVQVSVPAHAGRGRAGDPPKTVAPFQNKDGSAKTSVQMNQQFTADQLGTVYMDFLKDCPVGPSCDLCAADVFLVPRSPADYPDWVNTWVGGSYFKLDEAVLARSSFPMGNWVTMGDTRRAYPARLTGTVTGAPTGTRVDFVVPPGTLFSVNIPGDAATCRGNNVPVSLPFLIPADDNSAAANVVVTLPNSPCRRLQEGHQIRFSGAVVAEAGAPVYRQGDRIVAVEQVFIKDSAPPLLVSHAVSPDAPGATRVSVRIQDQISRPSIANLEYSVNRGPTRVMPMSVEMESLRRGDQPALDFATTLTGLPPRAMLGLSVRLADEAGNPATVPVGNFQTAGAGTLVNGASFQPSILAPASIVSLFGDQFASTSQAATGLPLPVTLAGAAVEVIDSGGVSRRAPLFFVSPSQVNLLVPPETRPGRTRFVLTAGGGLEAVAVAQIEGVAPALFSANANGRGVAAAIAVRAGAAGGTRTEAVYQCSGQPAVCSAIPIDLGSSSEQVYLLLFGTGIRPREGASAVKATIGGVPAEVQFAGPQSEYPGLDQINLLLPRSLAGRGEVPIAVTVEGKAANTVTVSIR